MKKIIIIGAGIAGLTAGVYAQKSGFETEIYEMHDKPGGECTGWQRGEYHFDGCIHWLVGSKPDTSLYEIWQDIGALDESVRIIHHNRFMRYEESGRFFDIYTDANKLEQHMLEISSRDKKPIKEFCGAIRAVQGLCMPIDKPMDMMTWKDGMRFMAKNIGKMRKVMKYDKVLISEFVKWFSDPLLRNGLASIMPNFYKASGLIYTLGGFHEGDCGYPLGGSLAMSRRIEEKYRALGGNVFYRAKVEKILISDGKAVGIRLADGREKRADYVISAADAYATLYQMLDDKYTPPFFKTLFSDNQTYPTQRCSLVMLGVDHDFSQLARQVSFIPKVPIDGGGKDNKKMQISHYCFDPSMAPKNKSVISVFIQSDFDYWQGLYKDKAKYKAEKKRLEKDVINAFTERFPEIKGKIEVTDVSTPMTYVRYCNAWRGSWMSWPHNMSAEHPRYFNGLLPGLDNFILAGMWTLPPGGLPSAAMSARFAVQRLCMGESVNFSSQ